MQRLKEEIRRNINNAALDLFSLHGVENVSMQKIAKAAGIAVGNIYNYYRNKNALYDFLIRDEIISEFKEIIIKKAAAFKGQDIKTAFQDSAFLLCSEQYFNFLSRYRREFIIILTPQKAGCPNPKRKEIVTLFSSFAFTFAEKAGITLKQEMKDLIIVLYDNMLGGMLEILKKHRKKETITDLISALTTYHLKGLLALL